jgi:hypothetical protein
MTQMDVPEVSDPEDRQAHLRMSPIQRVGPPGRRTSLSGRMGTPICQESTACPFGARGTNLS